MQQSNAPKVRQSFVVLVVTGAYTVAVFGPYRSFKAAEGDAKAWGGTVEPIQKPTLGFLPRK